MAFRVAITGGARGIGRATAEAAGARVEILPGVGHWAWLEQPGRVAGFVVPFLRERVGATVQETN